MPPGSTAHGRWGEPRSPEKPGKGWGWRVFLSGSHWTCIPTQQKRRPRIGCDPQFRKPAAPPGPSLAGLTQGEGVEDDSREGHAHQEPEDAVGTEGAEVGGGGPGNCQLQVRPDQGALAAQPEPGTGLGLASRGSSRIPPGGCRGRERGSGSHRPVSPTEPGAPARTKALTAEGQGGKTGHEDLSFFFF